MRQIFDLAGLICLASPDRGELFFFFMASLLSARLVLQIELGVKAGDTAMTWG